MQYILFALYNLRQSIIVVAEDSEFKFELVPLKWPVSLRRITAPWGCTVSVLGRCYVYSGHHLRLGSAGIWSETNTSVLSVKTVWLNPKSIIWYVSPHQKNHHIVRLWQQLIKTHIYGSCLAAVAVVILLWQQRRKSGTVLRATKSAWGGGRGRIFRLCFVPKPNCL